MRLHTRLTFTSGLFVISLACFGMFVDTAQGQYHFDPNGPTPVLDPVTAGIPVDPISAYRVNNGDYSLPYNVFWNTDGTAILEGTTSNGYTSGLTVGVEISIPDIGAIKVGTTFTKSMSYTLSLRQEGPGDEIIVLNWSKVDLDGQMSTGTIIVGRVLKSVPQQILPASSGNGGGTGNVSITMAGGGAGSGTGQGGHWEPITTYSQTSYFGDDGTMYVIGTYTTTYMWVPSTIGQKSYQ